MSDMRSQARTEMPRQRTSVEGGQQAPPEPTGWTGMVLFGGIMMTILGVFHLIAGIVALVNSGYYAVGASGLVVHVNYSGWGIAHLILGCVALAAGLGICLRGAAWARYTGVGIAALSALVNFAFLPAYPLWSLTMMVVDVLVIYALVAHGKEMRALRS